MKVKPYPFHGLDYNRDWDQNKVIVFGVGSTSLDIEGAVKKIKGEKAILKGGKSGGE